MHGKELVIGGNPAEAQRIVDELNRDAARLQREQAAGPRIGHVAAKPQEREFGVSVEGTTLFTVDI